MVRVRYSFGSRHTGRLDNIKKQRKKFPDIVKEVIKTCDIVLEILDARFVSVVEDKITDEGKKIIYVLNKSDLVNTSVLKKSLKIRPYVLVSCTKRVGGSKLRNLIKRMAGKIVLSEKMQRVQVGIIGYPNTGKSSVINLLIGKPSAKTGNEAGFTKGLQKVKLTNKILILDTPGVIAYEDYSMNSKEKMSKHARIGARSYSNVKNPDLAVQDLLDNSRLRKMIETFYSLDSKKDAELFLESLGGRKRFLKKGGVIDIDKTARMVLKDWQNGLVS